MNTLNRTGIVRGSCILLPCLAMTFATGCAGGLYASSQPVRAYPAPVQDDAVVYVDTVPANIEMYPHYYYGGANAYYVEGRWYRQEPRGWGYYRQEPPQLARQRPHVVQETPAPVFSRERSDAQRAPAPRERPYVQQAPEVSRPRPGVAEAQPRSGEAPRRNRPDDKRAAPPRDNQR